MILGTYYPPNQSIDYFFENVGKALDIYSQKYGKLSEAYRNFYEDISRKI